MPDGSSRLSPLPASPTWPPYAPRKPLWTRRPGGPDWMPITPKTGSLFHADSHLVVLGVREDGQKVLLAVKNMGGETSEAWRTVLDDLVKRGLRRPEFLIVDGGTGLEQALAALWGDVPTQRCTVHKHRNLLAHPPPRLHDEGSADYNDMIYATSAAEIEVCRRAYIRKWRL